MCNLYLCQHFDNNNLTIIRHKLLKFKPFHLCLGLPLPPQNFRLDTRTSNTITVKWDSSDKLIKNFELIITSKNNFTRTVNKLSQYNLAIVDGLLPATNYIIKIRTRSLAGFSNFTDPIEIRTMGSGMYDIFTKYIMFSVKGIDLVRSY